VNIEGPTIHVSVTPLMGIKNIIRVTQRGPLTPPTFYDITTDEHLYLLIMSGFESFDDQQMIHFGLTPFDVIPTG